MSHARSARITSRRKETAGTRSIYEGVDPVTGRERRSWHAAGDQRADAERLASKLAGERNGGNDETRSLTFGAYLTRR